MNIKKYWMMLAIVLVSLCTVSCGGDDDEEDALPNNENTKEVSTSTPKTITIGQTADSSCDIYAGYNNVYTLYVMDGYIRLLHQIRYGGVLSVETKAGIDQNQCGIIDIGIVSNISEIVTKKDIGGKGVDISHGVIGYNVVFQPSHGYSIMLTTDEGEKKYIRVYASGYSLDANGELRFVTIQYQLY